MESRFFVLMKWLPSGFPGSVAWLKLPQSAVGMESRFSVTMKWLPFGFPGSVTWKFSPPIWHDALEMTTFDKWPDLRSGSMSLEALFFRLIRGYEVREKCASDV
jgi:hypothetical protein